ncbi:uncharacterized protein EI90DRAFT_3035135 [Cantharellus anzutake]|uniref:uncharacterized protein n=1 Tax=Cantharellus anzutake TaxID=1750568 RepID=UPI001908E3F3|nr:uncharacterized protein EI90DRAFT_3035135 [Cantharellus anzutake]KAF8340305.1 hypothetical protein EI90DRAFT_3035135 [Cantharellus anzutake]
MTTSTGTYILLRALDGTSGISVGDAIYLSELEKRLRRIPNIGKFLNGRTIHQLMTLTQIQVRYNSLMGNITGGGDPGSKAGEATGPVEINNEEPAPQNDPSSRVRAPMDVEHGLLGWAKSASIMLRCDFNDRSPSGIP